MKRLMFVFPHPDDESFACAGTLAKCRDAGHETCLVCVTSGCKGRPGPFPIHCREELARHREQELACAADILGIGKLELLRYPDGGLSAVEPEELVERISQLILARKPNAVVTFPPDGVTGHPDHIAVSNATAAAVERAEQHLQNRECPSLYFVSIPHYYDHCLDKGPRPAVPITGKVDITLYRERKAEALRAHQSQEYSVNRAYPGVMNGDSGVIGCYEYYTLVREGGRAVTPVSPEKEIPLIDL
ncbi:PIG-L deacetylase family protein [Brevibacillus borstelensis]|uniref:PIG-L deacetylase family protein n=1 Tax=Brevibacillus borstelensis TaxID=45462 RepID=UPI0030BC02B9